MAESARASYHMGASFSSNPLACVRIATLPVPTSKLRERRSGKEGQKIGARKEAKVANETKKTKNVNVNVFKWFHGIDVQCNSNA